MRVNFLSFLAVFVYLFINFNAFCWIPEEEDLIIRICSAVFSWNLTSHLNFCSRAEEPHPPSKEKEAAVH